MLIKNKRLVAIKIRNSYIQQCRCFQRVGLATRERRAARKLSDLIRGASPESYRHHTMRGNALDLDVLTLRLGQRPRVVLLYTGEHAQAQQETSRRENEA